MCQIEDLNLYHFEEIYYFRIYDLVEHLNLNGIVIYNRI